ncbi:MAG: SDR family NAD(P)-dependent oxidoreductase, partial [Desulfobacterales bacterium]
MKTLPVQSALITGGGSGMGRTISLALCRSGIRVFVADVNLAAADKTVLAAQGLAGQAEARGVDVSQSTSV